MRKYELVKEDRIEVDGVWLYRIRAIKDFSNVRKGELGGYIQSEYNLSHAGKSWVYNNARVYNHAKVRQDACIYDEAKISGYARIFNKAKVYNCARVRSFSRVYDSAEVHGETLVLGESEVCGNARVFGRTRLFGTAKVSGNAYISGPYDIIWFSNVGSEGGTLTIFTGYDGNLLATRGCFEGTLEELLDKSREVHSDTVRGEYQLLATVARLKLGVSK